METRASYVIVGTFVLLMILSLFAFVVYLGKVQFDKVTQPYNIYFTGSVTGLQTGSPVRFRGVPIGTVTSIDIAPDNSAFVRVRVEVNSTVPIAQDAVATIELQGVTGVAYIQVIGGEKSAPPIAIVSGEIPVIPSKPSQIAVLFDAVPQLLNRMANVTGRAERFLSEENAASMTQVMRNMASLTSTLNSEGVATMTAFRDISNRFGETATALNNLAGTLNKTIIEANSILGENRGPIRDFTATSLYDFSLMIADFRELAATMARVLQQVERDPSGYLLGGPRQGVDAKKLQGAR